MNTDLTDARWALVTDLFERQGGRGTPARHPRKQMVDARCYVVHTGCAWRRLPKSLPPWRGVYEAFSRWAATGTFEAMHDRLRQQWGDRIGQPTAAIIDAQSTRSAAQGGLSVEVVRHAGNRSTGTWRDAQQPLWRETAPGGFVVQTKRWVVERTPAWNERARRLIAHHDRSSWAPVAWAWLVEARILATRLAT